MMARNGIRASTSRAAAACAVGVVGADLAAHLVVAAGRAHELVLGSGTGSDRNSDSGGCVPAPAAVALHLRRHLSARADPDLRRVLYVRAHPARQLGQRAFSFGA